MKKYIKFQYLYLVLVLFTVSCAEDLGNYSYNDINEVKFGGFQNEYTALLGEPFSISPELNFTDSSVAESNYTYQWTAIASFGLSNTQVKDLATTKDLSLQPVTLAPGKYTLVYKVTDHTTDVVWQKKMPFTVNSSIYQGWLLLNKTDTGSRLDMISYIDSTFTPIIDVLGYTQSSLKLEGDPIQVMAYQYDPNYFGIYVTTTGNGTTKIDPETFDWTIDLRLSYEMLSNVPSDFAADEILPISGGQSLMQKDGEVYYYYRVYQWRYGSPLNYVNGEHVTISPYIAQFFDTNIYYDIENQRFLKQSYNQSNMSEMQPGTLFDYNTGKDLLYMTRSTYNGGEVFALLNESGTSEIYLARLDMPFFQQIQTYYEKVPDAIAADMKQADHFAVSPDFGYIFYNVGGAVYQYDFSLKTSKLMVDKGSQEITVMQFDNNSPRALKDINYRSKLLIGTFNGSPAGGTFEIYNVPPVNGAIELIESYTGFDRIESAIYRYR